MSFDRLRKAPPPGQLGRAASKSIIARSGKVVSISQQQTYPWAGIIDSKGHSDVGFHKEPKPSTSKDDNIWPSLLPGDLVTVTGKTANNWLKITRKRDGKIEEGYVDWRYVKSVNSLEGDDFDIAKEHYFAIVDKGSDHYMEAINYLVSLFNLDTSKAIMSYDKDMTGAYAVTGGSPGDSQIPISFGPACFNKAEDFGVITRAIAHELLHVHQKAVLNMTSHDEREFLAYYDTITRTDMPLIEDMSTLSFFIEKAFKYYKNLSPDDQKKYRVKKFHIQRIKNKYNL